MSISRDEVFSCFGPFIMEAMCILIVKQLNTLRALHGLPALTKEQVGDALLEEINGLAPYSWMI